MKNIYSVPIGLLVLLAHCAAVGQKNIPRDIQSSLTHTQKQIVAALSGHSNIQGEVLTSRWTRKQKQIARNYLSSKLKDIGMQPQEYDYKVHLPHKKTGNPFRGTDVYSILLATVPSDEYIVIGAHYDSVDESPGAMDNATGCALVYGVTQLALQLEVRLKNLIVVFFDEEETGHAGSFAFANYLKKAGFKVHSVHTTDMVGWDSDKDRNIELELPTPALESLYRKHAQLFGISMYTTNTTLTDHREFRNAGFNAVGIGGEYKHGDTTPHHHQPTDTYNTVDFDYLAFVTYLVYKVIADVMSEVHANN